MKRAALLLGLLIVACGQPEAIVTVHLTAAHADPAAIREVWSTRFRNARDASLLPLMRANAQLDATGLVLDATLRTPNCDAATVSAMRDAIIDLTTARHTLAVHVTRDPEALATTLRETFEVDVHTPFEHPGQLVVQAPLARIAAALPPDAIVERSTATTSTLWLIGPIGLDGSAIASAKADLSDGSALELTLTEPGGATLEALSKAHRGQHLVVMIDGAFALAPKVVTTVKRSFRLDLPRTYDAATTLALARAIAASNLSDPPTLTSVEATCATPQ